MQRRSAPPSSDCQLCGWKDASAAAAAAADANRGKHTSASRQLLSRTDTVYWLAVDAAATSEAAATARKGGRGAVVPTGTVERGARRRGEGRRRLAWYPCRAGSADVDAILPEEQAKVQIIRYLIRKYRVESYLSVNILVNKNCVLRRLAWPATALPTGEQRALYAAAAAAALMRRLRRKLSSVEQRRQRRRRRLRWTIMHVSRSVGRSQRPALLTIVTSFVTGRMSRGCSLNMSVRYRRLLGCTLPHIAFIMFVVAKCYCVSVLARMQLLKRRKNSKSFENSPGDVLIWKLFADCDTVFLSVYFYVVVCFACPSVCCRTLAK